MHSPLLHSLKWSALGEIASKVLPPLFYIITARLLTPEDFGVVATSAMVVAFASILWEAGLSKALIQNQEHDNLQKMSNIVLYTNMFLSVLLYIVLFFSSDSIASFFHDERVADVLQISGLSLIIGSLMSVQTALLQKAFGFKKLFFSRFIGAIIPGIVSVILAYCGYGYWALVYGTIVSMIFQALILWKISPWRPSYEYDLEVTKKMFHFSKWIFSTSLLYWFFAWGDIFVLGYFLTSHELGLYRTGTYFSEALTGLIIGFIAPVMYSHFSLHQKNIEKIKNDVLLGIKYTAIVLLPLSIVIIMNKNIIATVIFGDNWIGISIVLAYTIVAKTISSLLGFSSEAYKAIGRSDVETKILSICILYYFMAYLIVAPYGLEFFLLARLFLLFSSNLIHFYFLKKLFNITLKDFVYSIKFTIIPICIASVLVFWIYDVVGISNTIVLGFLFIFFFYGSILIPKNNEIHELLKSIRRM